MRLRTCGSQTDELQGKATDSKGTVPVVRWMYSHSSRTTSRATVTSGSLESAATTASSDWQQDPLIASNGSSTSPALDWLSATFHKGSGISGATSSASRSGAPPPRQARLGALAGGNFLQQETALGSVPTPPVSTPRGGSLTLPPVQHATASGQTLLSGVQESTARPPTPIAGSAASTGIKADVPTGISTGGAPPPARRALTPQPAIGGHEVAPVPSSASSTQVSQEDRCPVTPPRSGANPSFRWQTHVCSSAREVALKRVSRSTSPTAGRTYPILYRYQGMTRTARSNSPPKQNDINTVKMSPPASDASTASSLKETSVSEMAAKHLRAFSPHVGRCVTSSPSASTISHCNHDAKPGLQLWDAEARTWLPAAPPTAGHTRRGSGILPPGPMRASTPPQVSLNPHRPLGGLVGPYVSSPRMVSWVSVAPPNGVPPQPIAKQARERLRSPKPAREPRLKGLTTSRAPRPVHPSPVRPLAPLGLRPSATEASEREPATTTPPCSSVGPTPKIIAGDDGEQRLTISHAPGSPEDVPVVTSVGDVLKVGDPVIVRGRRGTVTWCGLPTHEFAAVRWLDNRKESEPMPLEIIDRDEEERED